MKLIEKLWNADLSFIQTEYENCCFSWDLLQFQQNIINLINGWLPFFQQRKLMQMMKYFLPNIPTHAWNN